MQKELKKRFNPPVKLTIHEEFARFLSGKSVAPINIEISPSGICDADCPDCFYRQENRTLKGHDSIFFDNERMKKLIEEFSEDKNFKVKSISWTGGGEPTLHPLFPRFVEWVNEKGIEQGLFTNALKSIKYNPTLFKWIRVTKTDKDWNENNLHLLRQCETLGLCINYAGQQDDKIIEEAIKIGEKIGVDYIQIRPALKILGKKVSMEIPKIEHPLIILTDYKFLGSNAERNYKYCKGFHFAPFIWQDGDVDVCSYHRKNQQYNLGNLYGGGEKGGFRYIMENAPYSVPVIENCQICCKLNSMNSFIKLAEESPDKNFP